jgi:hypothetical protein
MVLFEHTTSVILTLLKVDSIPRWNLVIELPTQCTLPLIQIPSFLPPLESKLFRPMILLFATKQSWELVPTTIEIPLPLAVYPELP